MSQTTAAAAPSTASETATPAEGTATTEVLEPLRRNRPFMLLMTGLTAQSLGGSVTRFAVPLLALQLTGSPTAAGLVAAIGQTGALLAALPAGVVADRTDRRRLVVVAAATAALLWATVVVAGVLGGLAAWHLAAVLFGAAVATAFLDPAISGAFRSVVPQAQLPTAYATAQGRDAVAGMLGGPLGGALYGIAHVVPMVGAVVGGAATAVCAFFVREPLNGDVDAARATRPLVALRQGLRFVWSVPLFRACLGMFVVVNIALSGMMIGINLELARTGTAPVLIGVFDMVAAGSMLLGSVLAPPLVARARLGAVTVVSLGLLVVAFAGMALVQTYVGYVVLIGVGVLLVPAVNSAMAGYTAAITPDRMQGRLASVLGLSGVAAMPVAPLVGGALLGAGGIGVVLWSLVALLAATVVGLALVPSLWRVGAPDAWADDALPMPAE
ncbi:MFS transporter [Krasilnikoviella flava]|uniref:Major Facilitator Superfamily protein n=1 Tax=Krasilnikoviella flava TaxID=526729 RepID=A0A1T5JGB2_9MICO|nr:MFS transporter [Krasilnikoviella flava]SKC50218.1 Major Facilitator Superfamily protein [Krasilnikoviella flava]